MTLDERVCRFSGIRVEVEWNTKEKLIEVASCYNALFLPFFVRRSPLLCYIPSRILLEYRVVG